MSYDEDEEISSGFKVDGDEESFDPNIPLEEMPGFEPEDDDPESRYT